MLAIIIILSLFLVLILAVRRSPVCFDDEEKITTTITEERPNIVGNLKRQIEGVQAYVIDPVDNEKIWLNSNDDLYEDAEGRIWWLI